MKIKVKPYLVFQGNANAAFEFYRDCLQGELEIMRYSMLPEGAMPNPVPEELKDKVMHVNLKVGAEVVLMGTDSVSGMGPNFNYGDSFFVSCHFEVESEAREALAKLSRGGRVLMEFQQQFWGGSFAMCQDKFGVYWTINQ